MQKQYKGETIRITDLTNSAFIAIGNWLQSITCSRQVDFTIKADGTQYSIEFEKSLYEEFEEYLQIIDVITDKTY